MENDFLVQMGASLYGLVNILSYGEYQKITGHQSESQQFLRKLNEN